MTGAEILAHFVDSTNAILDKFLYLLMLFLMTLSLFIGNFFFDD